MITGRRRRRCRDGAAPRTAPNQGSSLRSVLPGIGYIRSVLAGSDVIGIRHRSDVSSRRDGRTVCRIDGYSGQNPINLRDSVLKIVPFCRIKISKHVQYDRDSKILSVTCPFYFDYILTGPWVLRRNNNDFAKNRLEEREFP